MYDYSGYGFHALSVIKHPKTKFLSDAQNLVKCGSFQNQTEAALWGEFQFQSVGDYQQINILIFSFFSPNIPDLTQKDL